MRDAMSDGLDGLSDAARDAIANAGTSAAKAAEKVAKKAQDAQDEKQPGEGAVPLVPHSCKTGGQSARRSCSISTLECDNLSRGR